MSFSRNIIIAFAALLFLVSVSGCKQRIRPAQGPEEVVKRFYAYIQEGGPTTINEAYRLVDTKSVDEEGFKKTVSGYPKEMNVKVVKAAVDEDKQRAVVTIEYQVESSFGGYVTTGTDINLKLDPEARAWKIDFTGDTYDESPAMYQKEGQK